MRLNFSGCDEDQIREGIRRIGEVVTEQVALYGSLTGAEEGPRRQRPEAPEGTGARVLPLPTRAERASRAEGS